MSATAPATQPAGGSVCAARPWLALLSDAQRAPVTRAR